MEDTTTSPPTDCRSIVTLLEHWHAGAGLPAAARRHRVEPQLAREWAGDDMTRAVWRRTNAMRVLCLVAEHARIHTALGAIPYLTLKGLTLAVRYYGDVVRRDAGDIDLLVAPGRLDAAIAALEQAGYAADDELGALTLRQRRWYLFANHHCHFSGTVPGVTIELHWRLMDNPYAFNLLPSADGAWPTEHVWVGNVEAPALPLEELLLYLCAHGANHAWFRLKWACDLVPVLENRTWDWPAMFERARGLGCEVSLGLGLLLAHRLFEWPLPPVVVERITALGGLEREFAVVMMAIQGPESWWDVEDAPLRVSLRLRWYQWRLARGWRARLRGLARLATNAEDWKLLPLPDWLFWLYFPLRPFLVLWRRAAGIARARADA